jgi:hypothetical protein
VAVLGIQIFDYHVKSFRDRGSDTVNVILGLALVAFVLISGCTGPNSPVMEDCDPIADCNPIPVLKDCESQPLEGLKDACYAQQALIQEKPELCSPIKTVLWRDECYDNLVEELTSEDLDKVRTENNERWCHEIVNVEQRDACFYTAAQNLLDADVCEFIQDAEEKRRCSEYLNPFGSPDSDADYAQPGDPEPVDRSNPAMIAVCEAENTQNKRDVCFGVEADKQRDPELCVRVVDDEKRDQCFANLFDGYIEYAECINYVDSITDSNFKEGCYQYLAVQEKDTSYCDSIENESTRAICKLGVCEVLEDEAAAAQCFLESGFDDL